MRLTINLVTYNGEKYIPYLFESLRKQTYQDWELLVLDNNSSDDTVDLIKKQSYNLNIPFKLIENKENIGFAGGHNQLYRISQADYILILNQDIYLEPDCLEKMVRFLDNNLNAVAVAPRLMRFSDKDLHRFMTDSRKLQISEGQIDGLGLKVMRNRRVVDKYAQKKWEDIKGKVNLSYHTKNEMMEVFGLSGAMAMYRSSVIKDVETTPGKIYDESYLSYKEDVDLAFRLRSAGCN